MFKNPITLTKDEEIRVALDPYRLNILQIFRNHKEPLTVQQLSKIVGDAHGKVHYHVKKLIDVDLLELVKTEIINGITAKYYKRKYDVIYFNYENLSEDAFSIYKSVNQQAFNNCLIEYKKDVIKNVESLDEDTDEFRDLISWRKQYLYLSPEEFKEFMDDMKNIYDKYSKKDESKDEYAVLMAVSRVK